MSLDYYLSLRKLYQKILNDIDNILILFNDVHELSIENRFDLSDETYEENCETSTTNIDVFIERRKHILYMKNICDKQIEHLCDHDFECDTIDITPERSHHIEYCKICEYTRELSRL
jgi:hypothetical protein